MNEFVLEPLPLLIEADVNDPHEVEGILNPAAARGPDGELYLFPRIVGKGNYSRIGIMRVLFDDEGEPTGVERIGIALEPEAPYELRGDGMGGCEDPRVTYVEPIDLYVMTYTAFSVRGPRIAIAVSRDLFHWDRLGLAKFDPVGNITFDVDNKDAVMFPRPVPGPARPPVSDHDPEIDIRRRESGEWKSDSYDLEGRKGRTPRRTPGTAAVPSP